LLVADDDALAPPALELARGGPIGIVALRRSMLTTLYGLRAASVARRLASMTS